MAGQMPPRNPVKPDLMQRIADLEEEVRRLKERPQREDVPRQKVSNVTFSYHGVVLNADPSGAYLVKDFAATIHRIDYTATNPPTKETTWQLLVNGVVVYTWTVAAGTTVQTDNSIAVDIEEYDKVTVNCTTYENGQKNVVLNVFVTAIEGNEYT